MKNCDILIPNCLIGEKKKLKQAETSGLPRKPAHNMVPMLHPHNSSITEPSRSNIRGPRLPLKHACSVRTRIQIRLGLLCNMWLRVLQSWTENWEHPCSQNHVQNQPPPGYLGNKIFFFLQPFDANPLWLCSSRRKKNLKMNTRLSVFMLNN